MFGDHAVDLEPHWLVACPIQYRSMKSSLPEHRLNVAQNMTPFDLFAYTKMAPGRRYSDVVSVRGTFALAPGRLRLATTQTPVALTDDFWMNDPIDRSSLRSAGDAVLFKPSTDVMVTGTVRAPRGEPRSSWYASISVGSPRGKVLEHTLQVTGPRRFQHRRMRGWVVSDPEPATEAEVRYELAYGGAYVDRAEWCYYDPNPSGTGYFDEQAMDRNQEYAAPRWQTPSDPVTQPNKEVPLAGFGPIMRPWAARYRYAGTCDDAYVERMRADVKRGLPTDYPADLDMRFFQCAHPALITPSYLLGDEEISLLGMTPDGPLTMQLPRVILRAWLADRSGVWHDDALRLDTVHIDLDRELVYLGWRLTLDQARNIDRVYVGAMGVA